MAEQTVVDLRRSIPLDDGVDPLAIAAAMNPAMSSWGRAAEAHRVPAGSVVLILGATGSAGQLAIQVSKHLARDT
ncbi:MAG: hypothetical protein WDM88_03080 [Galbitalea sp.]